MLKISDLKVSIAKKQILKGVDFEVKRGEFHVIMGPNGSGKSTLAQVIAGHPSYKVESGELRVESRDIKKMTPDKRANLGIFLGFQHPVEIPGVSVFNVLRKTVNISSTSLRAKRSNLKKKKIATSPRSVNMNVAPRNDNLNISAFREQLLEYASSLKLSDDFLRRSLNEGFSGGEKKRSEIVQMLALKPKLVILDEIDSGLDVDGLELVASAIKRHAKETPYTSFIVITHYARILKYLKPDFVHVMVEGRIVKSGRAKLAQEVESKGYQKLTAVFARNEMTKQSNRSPRRV